jgi:hypothetical protein
MIDLYQELLSIVKTSKPKITKWIEDDAGEDDAGNRIGELYLDCAASYARTIARPQ